MASHVSAVRCTIEADGDVLVVETLVVKMSWVEGTAGWMSGLGVGWARLAGCLGSAWEEDEVVGTMIEKCETTIGGAVFLSETTWL